ncbi:uncharacterized protein N7515_005158 [Penicillium bovifimosum]|uniref:Uncharacterized protein n=1 Tax=Penicillium bovifimosum TaxID=126998 RepID=A0A9W9H1L0_9EURO|nr:uncharacterized protein N7515_005158 [Penicillium bovifimosum]KAJ5135880.1 hypothetical protein N7515_005158 [Penicillium bovifimosum]
MLPEPPAVQATHPISPEPRKFFISNSTTHEEYSSNWAGAVLIGKGLYFCHCRIHCSDTQAPIGCFFKQAVLCLCVGWHRRRYLRQRYPSRLVLISAFRDALCRTMHGMNGTRTMRMTSLASRLRLENKIKVTVDATSKTTGTATIENVSTGKTVTHTFTGGVDGDLCEYNAEWIVEDFSSNEDLVRSPTSEL